MEAPTPSFALMAWVSCALLAGYLSAPRVAEQGQSPVGCYHLRLGAWSKPVDRGFVPPPVFRLDSALAVKAASVARKVEPQFLHTRGPWPLWFVDHGDTIQVIWSTGFQGVALSLKEQGDTLRGIAHTFTDVVGLMASPQASATAVRVNCRIMDSPSGGKP